MLSVLAQCSIDNAKRKFDIDLNEEIARIKKDSNVDKNKKPSFWFDIKKKDKFSKKMTAKDKLKKKEANLNENLKCPMNYLGTVKFKNYRSNESELDMDYFFVKYDLELNRRKSKKVEEIIEKYSFDLYRSKFDNDDDDKESYFLLREDFDEMIEDIKRIYMSDSYLGLMSWLIDRAFGITTQVKNNNVDNAKIIKNKSILLSTLYEINKDNLLKCFSKNTQKS